MNIYWKGKIFYWFCIVTSITLRNKKLSCKKIKHYVGGSLLRWKESYHSVYSIAKNFGWFAELKKYKKKFLLYEKQQHKLVHN